MCKLRCHFKLYLKKTTQIAWRLGLGRWAGTLPLSLGVEHGDWIWTQSGLGKCHYSLRADVKWDHIYLLNGVQNGPVQTWNEKSATPHVATSRKLPFARSVCHRLSPGGRRGRLSWLKVLTWHQVCLAKPASESSGITPGPRGNPRPPPSPLGAGYRRPRARD